ncbi:VCBS repeat domain-containing M23 family metallopeptidase [Sandaracinus amylolyticus]|uniref:VCBS repeat domain-containing M23 family metallopeptidase n=1 Tax=Sandaracinus amylolyticus TaxID=927083 RepID=UPI001F277734|nr:VCBS repeat domain-containing M23 family metallopeptidase [Sandaracinus amylolyticus]UJR85759.1 Hypothetical protein I5071_78390 [Sandaracinus amylolyticus]
MGRLSTALVVVLVLGACTNAPEVDVATEAVRCNPVVTVYPVRGRHNHGYDRNAGNSSLWTCDDAYSNEDFIAGDHIGNDIWAAEGTPVVATSAGRLTLVGFSNYSGNKVTVIDDCGWYHFYCHLQRIAPGIRDGVRVTAGQVIGYVGRTGTASNGVVHLHYSIYPDGDYDRGVDPWRYTHPVERNVCGASCTPGAEVCNGRDDDCDGSSDEDEVCEVALLQEQPHAYAPPTTTDVNADGRADVCARGASGVRCWTSREGGWNEAVLAAAWSDAGGWGDVANYATIRMGDVNADGRADLCARANDDVWCAVATADGFAAPAVWRPAISDANGWGNPRFYTTLRLADVNGDRREDLCARDSQGFGCWLSDGTRFDRRIDGPRWSDAAGWGAARFYGTLRMGDVNGDRRSDVCARSSAGVECWLADGEGFPTRVMGPAWSDESGWGAMHYWSTMRLADVNGDGRADVCARSSTDLRCVLATESGFGETVIVAPLSNGSGWSDRSNYATLRVGDVNGDGADDLCARANAQVHCWTWDGDAFVGHAGPAWDDANGWSAAHYYDTIQLADVSGDGLDDICARAAVGWICQPSAGDSFGAVIELGDMSNDQGWTDARYWTTILSSSRTCRSEMEACNGRDDDCDGEVDEHAADEICNGVDDDCDELVDENASGELCNGRDDDCDGTADDGLSCTIDESDGGVPTPRGDGGTGGGRTRVDGGCAVSSGSSASAWWMVMAAMIAVVTRRRRR